MLMKIDKGIFDVCDKISSNIDVFYDNDVGLLAQNIINDLRHLVEAVISKIYLKDKKLPDMYVDFKKTIEPGLEYIKSIPKYKFLRDFHKQLKISVSHYSRDKDNSERLLYKYLENLYKIRSFLEEEYELSVLDNLEKINLERDKDLKEYYRLIAEKIDKVLDGGKLNDLNERYYIWKKKPFFVNKKIYYEITVVEANDKFNKFDRFVFYTKIDINPYYAIKVEMSNDNIIYEDLNIPIFIVTDYEVAIRPCEIKNFAAILNQKINMAANYSDYKVLMRYLKETNYSLVDIINFEPSIFNDFIKMIENEARSKSIIDMLIKSREIIINDFVGKNILKFLLLNLNNKNIRKQSRDYRGMVAPNEKISDLRLKNGCLPFEEMPYCSSPLDTNVRLWNLLEIIETKGREHEFLARFITQKAEKEKQIFTDISELKDFQNINELIEKYNNNLHISHKNREIDVYKGKKIYIKSYDINISYVIEKIVELTKIGVKGYTPSVKSWLDNTGYVIDCKDKLDGFVRGFNDSRVFVIYGAAGTGKTKLLEHFTRLFYEGDKIFLSYTHASLENLKRRMPRENTHFYTVQQYLSRIKKTPLISNILFIDECSTISNEHMKKILENANFDALILSGDPYQIESITFGNWFELLKSFIPKESYVTLTTPHRTNKAELIKLWDKVREFSPNIHEYLTEGNYSSPINKEILEKKHDNEIILCLNYDGLYGINNVNKLLQQKNPNPAVRIGVNEYKVGDPILFNENSTKYEPLLYNNAKGTIRKIFKENNRIKFHIELDKAINEMSLTQDLKLVDLSSNNKSIIELTLDEKLSSDYDNAESNIPFNISYAVSIHKSQGLEYDSVKIIIVDEVEEMITHNIFYTAITRTKDILKIFWSPKTQNKIISEFQQKKQNADANIISSRHNLKLIKK